MNREKANKMIAIGMLLIIVVSMMNYPVVAVEEVIEYVSEKRENTVGVEENETIEEIEEEIAEVAIVAEEVDTAIEVEVPIYQEIYQKIVSIQEKIEDKANEITFEQAHIVLYTFIQSCLGKQIYIDGGQTVVLMDNGYLTMVTEEEQDIDLFAENLIELEEYLADKGTEMLYVQAPYKISMYDNQLPVGVEDNNNAIVSSLLAVIDGSVDYIDLRVEMYEAGMNQYDYFFLTDHHWTPEAGFWAFTVIAETLNEEYGFDIDESLMDMENYNIEVYENWFLGSIGKRVGPYLVEADDISIITPNFETELSIEIPSLEIDNQGSYEDILIDYTLLNEIDYWNDDVYGAYICGDKAYVRITNHDSESDKKILIISDSFGKVVTPFLTLGCSQVDIIDLRLYKDGSLIEYLEENEYDMVIHLRNTSTVNEENFTFDEVY